MLEIAWIMEVFCEIAELDELTLTRFVPAGAGILKVWKERPAISDQNGDSCLLTKLC